MKKQLFQNSGKIPAFVTAPQGNVQIKMRQEWLKRNPQTAVKDLGYTQTIPGVTVYGAKDNKTNDVLYSEEFTPKDRELWYENDRPNIRQSMDLEDKTKIGNRAYYQPGNKPTMYLPLHKGNKVKLNSTDSIKILNLSKELSDLKSKDKNLFKKYFPHYTGEITDETFNKVIEQTEKRLQQDKTFYNSINKKEKEIEDSLFNRSTLREQMFAELAHANQYKKSPILSKLRSIEGNLFYEDNADSQKGRYGVEGQLEHEAHFIIEPQLIEESKKPAKNTPAELIKFKNQISDLVINYLHLIKLNFNQCKP